ncbi:MAG: hypothetical protein ACK502_09550 [Alphaproteobacteria bacterium]
MQNIAKFLFIALVFTAVSYPSSQLATGSQNISLDKPDPFINVA